MMTGENQKRELLELTSSFINSSRSFSRREFLFITGGMIIAVSSSGARGAK
jgi:hypothetical protein